MRLLPRLALLLTFLVAGPLSSTAQIVRPTGTPYVRLGAGPSVSETDISTYAVEPYSIHGEIGYQFIPWLSLGFGVTHADYPKANPDNSLMTTFQGISRWTFYPRSDGSPYLNVGTQLTTGGDNLAGGVLFGLGYDYVVGRRTSVFAEATANATFPDAGIDGRDDGRATFDGLGFWGAGVRVSLEEAPHPPVIRSVETPDTLYRGVPASFTVRLSEESSRPLDYSWRFGDGGEGSGRVVETVYPLPGDYTVRVSVSNAAGEAHRRVPVEVRERVDGAEILAFQADTTVVREGERVRFTGATRGTQPLSLRWEFGGKTSLTEEVLHQYEASDRLGALKSKISQTYTFDEPGTHDVSLAVNNRFGDDRASVSIRVRDRADTPVRAAMDPCRQARVPDTVYFEFDRRILRPPSVETLESKVDLLEKCPNLSVRLTGYADWVGPASYNRSLSRSRADAVRDFYVDEGIEADRFTIRGYGELDPPCPLGEGGKGCRLFRRVESVVVIQEQVGDAGPQSDRDPLSSSKVHEPPARDGSPDPAPRGHWSLVVGSYARSDDARAAAQTFRDRLGDRDRDVRIRRSESGRRRVLIGRFASSSEAMATYRTLRAVLPAETWPLRVQRSVQQNRNVATSTGE